MKIAVFGSSIGASPDTEEKATIVGRTIAEHGCTIVTGGCGGLPGIAASAAIDCKGQFLGFTPARNKKEHLERFGLPEQYGTYVYVPEELAQVKNYQFLLKYRNVFSSDAADACVIIGGRIGTLNELTIMYDMGKIIGVLTQTGGVTDHIKKIIDTSGKHTGAKIIYDDHPQRLVEAVVSALSLNVGSVT
jgi:predicted Rossmann-fold nucleotide-binding protein